MIRINLLPVEEAKRAAGTRGAKDTKVTKGAKVTKGTKQARAKKTTCQGMGRGDRQPQPRRQQHRECSAEADCDEECRLTDHAFRQQSPTLECLNQLVGQEQCQQRTGEGGDRSPGQGLAIVGRATPEERSHALEVVVRPVGGGQAQDEEHQQQGHALMTPRELKPIARASTGLLVP